MFHGNILIQPKIFLFVHKMLIVTNKLKRYENSSSNITAKFIVINFLDFTPMWFQHNILVIGNLL